MIMARQSSRGTAKLAMELVVGLSACLCFAPLAFADSELAVTGIVANPLHLSLADLRGLPSAHVAVSQASGHGPVTLDCTGVTIASLLKKAAPAFGPKNNANLAHTLLITADDGYAVALSLGEIDPDYGHVEPIVATDCSGKPLAAPRLVVPGDIHAGRAVNGIVSIEVR
jgi:DMSO/TMAO reductase YedYZ molybdopterin-dependent catalytic subunit